MEALGEGHPSEGRSAPGRPRVRPREVLAGERDRTPKVEVWKGAQDFRAIARRSLALGLKTRAALKPLGKC